MARSAYPAAAVAASVILLLFAGYQIIQHKPAAPDQVVKQPGQRQAGSGGYPGAGSSVGRPRQSTQRPTEGRTPSPAEAAKQAEFFQRFQKAMATTNPKARLEALREAAEAAPSRDLLEMVIPAMQGSGEPQVVWNTLKGLYSSTDLESLPAVADAMQAMSVPAYFTVLVETIAARGIDPQRQVLAVQSLREMAATSQHPRPPIQSSLAYTALDNPHVEVRSATLSALSDIGDDSIESRLTEYIQSEQNSTLRSSARDVLATVSARAATN